jgi:hypothetical protein
MKIKKNLSPLFLLLTEIKKTQLVQILFEIRDFFKKSLKKEYLVDDIKLMCLCLHCIQNSVYGKSRHWLSIHL